MCYINESIDCLSRFVNQSNSNLRQFRLYLFFVLFLDTNTNPCVIELQRANVEEVHLKDKPFCLKLTVDDGKSGTLFLALKDEEEFSRWLKRLRKVFIELFIIDHWRFKYYYFRQQINYLILQIILQVIWN